MASSTTLRLIWESTNRTSGTIRQINGDIESQKQKLKELQATESARAAQARAGFAQQRSLDAFNKLQTDNSVANQFRYQRALEASRAASARASIANQRASLSLSNVGQQASNAGGLLTSFGGAAGLAAGAIAAGFAAAAVAVGAFANAIQGAIDRESALIGSTTELARGLNLSRTEARGLSEEILRGVARETVGTGFGTRATEVAQQLLPTIARAGLSTAETEDLAVSLSSRLGGVLANEDPGRTQNFLIDFFNEDNIGRVLQQDINPQLRNSLREVLRRRGLGEDLSAVSTADRLKVLQEAANIALPDEALLEQASTVKGQFNALLDKLFNPTEGLFGVERDLDPNVGGYQTVFEAFKTSTATLIGQGGVFDNFGKLLESVGLSGDPLVPIRNALLGFNDFLVDLNQTLIGIRQLNERLENAGIEIGRVFSEIGEVLDFLGNFSPTRLLNPFTFANDVEKLSGGFRESGLGAGETPSIAEKSFPSIAPKRSGVGSDSSGSVPRLDLSEVTRNQIRLIEPVKSPDLRGNVTSITQIELPQAVSPKESVSRSNQIQQIGPININQQPGQDAKALADEMLRQVDILLNKELISFRGASG